MTIYKYLHPDRIDVLQNGAIRFTQPIAFNDPFETMPCYVLYKEYARERLIGHFEETFNMIMPPEMLERLPELIDEQIDGLQRLFSECFGVLSLTKKRNNLLMWAHYADSHRGFVVGFNSESTLFKPGQGKGLQGLREVKYSRTREVVPRGGMAALEGEELEKMNDAFFFTKSDNWSYEEEFRILAYPKAADIT